MAINAESMSQILQPFTGNGDVHYEWKDLKWYKNTNEQNFKGNINILLFS